MYMPMSPGERVGDFRPVVFDDQQVTIKLNLIVDKDAHIKNKIVFQDLFAKHYRGQPIHIIAKDGENVKQSGFSELLIQLQQVFDIPDHKITFYSILPPNKRYQHVAIPGEFFCRAGENIKPIENFDPAHSRFVGALAASRFSVMRLRTLYELDRHFPNDTYLTFNATADAIRNRLVDFEKNYQEELAWVQNKKFDDPGIALLTGGINLNGLEASANVVNVQNKFSIEVILETDDYANNWFTEKTARCLAMGKPFVMMAGTDALINLRKLGYHTFGSVLDESYDQELAPTKRLNKIIESLTQLYQDPARHKIIKSMYDIASHNREIYQRYVSTQI